MKKEVFIAIINAIKAQREFDRAANEKMSEIFIDFDGWYNTDIAITPIEDALMKEFDDENEWISYFMYDLDYGEDYTKDSVTEKDGTPIDLSTVEKLYDFLAKDV